MASRRWRRCSPFPACRRWRSVTAGWAGPTRPSIFPRVARYLAVDHTCRDRLRVRARPRRGPRPGPAERDRSGPSSSRAVRCRPGRHARWCSATAPAARYLDAIRQACAAQGIAVDVAGYRAGTVLGRPQDVLGQYDLVFAKGKAALEAAAVGAAVVLADVTGIGEMVTTANFAALRPLNFGLRALRAPADRRRHRGRAGALRRGGRSGGVAAGARDGRARDARRRAARPLRRGPRRARRRRRRSGRRTARREPLSRRPGRPAPPARRAATGWWRGCCACRSCRGCCAGAPRASVPGIRCRSSSARSIAM